MDGRELKKYLAGISIASLVAAGHHDGRHRAEGLGRLRRHADGCRWHPGAAAAAGDEAIGMSLNGKPVKNAVELQAALDSLAPGAAVKIVYKVKGADRVIEGVAK